MYLRYIFTSILFEHKHKTNSMYITFIMLTYSEPNEYDELLQIDSIVNWMNSYHENRYLRMNLQNDYLS